MHRDHRTATPTRRGSRFAALLGAAIVNFAVPSGAGFWTLPLLSITGLEPGHLLGYTAAIMPAAS